MSRQIVILALVLFAIIGLSAAVPPSTSPDSAPSNDVIGNTDSGPGSGSGSDDDTEAGPIGGPVPAGVFPETPGEAPVGSPSSNAGDIKVSAVAGAIVVVAAVFL